MARHRRDKRWPLLQKYADWQMDSNALCEDVVRMEAVAFRGGKGQIPTFHSHLCNSQELIRTRDLQLEAQSPGNLVLG